MAGLIPATAGLVEVLDNHVASGTETEYTFTPAAALTLANYSKIMCVFALEPSEAMDVSCEINADTTANYYDDGFDISGGTDTLIDHNTLAAWVVAPIEVIASAESKTFVVEFYPQAASGWLEPRLGAYSYGFATPGVFALGHAKLEDLSSFTAFKYTVSAGNWKAGTQITHYGFKTS